MLFQEVPKGQSEEDMVGRPLPHLGASMQACGEAVYCDDIPRYQNELSLRLVTSTRAHAKIKTRLLIRLLVELSSTLVWCITKSLGTWQVHSLLKQTHLLCNQDSLGSHIASPGEFYIGGQEHFYLETHCTIAVPKGEAGEMELFVSTQNTMKTQAFAAKVLGVPANRILVRVKRLGGGFGGKETRSTVVSTAVALAAYKTGCPVRCMLDRDEDMLITGGRHPFLARYKVGFMKTGRIVALEVDHYSNAGNTLDLSEAIMDRALFHMDNCYKIPNIRGTGRLCKTNLPSNTAFRGFGGPQGMLIAEQWMSEVAVTCGLPAEEVRRKNMYKEGDLTHFNQKLEGFTLTRCWDECLASSQYHARKSEIDKFNKENCWKKRGLCIVPTKFGISFTVSFLNQAGALIHVYTDGSVLLTHGGTEMGQGLHTKMVQVSSLGLWESSLTPRCLYEGRCCVKLSSGTYQKPKQAQQSLSALQVEGAFVQGLGLFTLEELQYSPEGSLYTRGPSTYKIPAFGSIPIEFRVSLLRDSPNKKAIYASKAIGEPPLFLASSIFFAIKDAIRAARAQHSDNNIKELFRLDSPATPEKIRNACVDKFTTLCVTGVPENCKAWSLRV
ncbi:xanthine dehydrogenase/oxidase-like [Equus quagga]|uniref:xanthine dehydrogenase/oxidase-like n=1 Tax=Equus quagga TaxID=89248 RepID=UPI001EE245BF|nr:xanthine dehydrogenase/oxidase-like [Equus quagga]